MRDPAVQRGCCRTSAGHAGSREITLAEWQRRPLWEKVVGPFVWILERQQ